MADETTRQTRPPTGDPAQSEDGKTFTQADLDRIAEGRGDRKRGKYADSKERKKAKGELDTLKAGQLSETEKITKRATEAETKGQQAEARLRETVTRLETVP